MAEQYVSLLCHWKGCEVFRNNGCTGDTDMVIVHPELGALRVDVKCSTWEDDGKGRTRWNHRGHRVKAQDVYAVVVTPEGDFSQWRVRWQNTRRGKFSQRNPIWRCPSGWESFWNNDHRLYTTTSTKPTHATPAPS